MRFAGIGKTSDDLNSNHCKEIESQSSSAAKTSDGHFSVDSILSNPGLTTDCNSPPGALLNTYDDEPSVNEFKKGALIRNSSNPHLPQDEVPYPSNISTQNFSIPSDSSDAIDWLYDRKSSNKIKEDTTCLPTNFHHDQTGKVAIIPLQKDFLNGNTTCKNLSLYDNPVNTPPPLVLEVPKISASVTTANIKEICLDGLRYASNITSLLPASQDLKASPFAQEFDEICINECNDATFGAKIQAPGDLVLNQYVDFNSGLADHSGIIVTDSSPPNTCCIRYKYLWLSLIIAMFLGATAVAIILIQADHIADAVDPDGQSPANYTERLVKRGQWSSYVDAKLDDLTVYPARNTMVYHTADFFCNDRVVCENRVRAIESYHLQIGFTSIGYSFLIGGDGLIYEGRGWGKYGAFTPGLNCNSVGVGFIGNYDKDKLTPTMVNAFNVLMEEGVRRGALITDYKLFGHYQAKVTSSPGLDIIQAMKSWPHFTAQMTEADKCT